MSSERLASALNKAAGSMAIYYIDTDDGEARHRDRTGVELETREDARKLVLSALPDMARDKMPDGDRRTFRAVARGEDGAPVYRATMTLVGAWD